MEIFAFWRIAHQLIMVSIAQPRHLSAQSHSSRLALGARRKEVAARLFPLVGIGGGVERICAVADEREARLHVKAQPRVVVDTLPIRLISVEVAIVHRSVAAPIAGRERGHEASAAPARQCEAAGGFSHGRAVTAALRLRFSLPRHALAGIGKCGVGEQRGGARHDVDGTRKRLAAEHARGCAFENFDALDVGNVDGEIRGVVPRLGIVERNAVEKDSDLVERSAVDTKVCLHAEGTALPDVHARCELEDVANAGDARRRSKVFARKRHHLPCRHVGGQGSACARHYRLCQFETVLPCGSAQRVAGRVDAHRRCSDAGSSRGERGGAKHTDAHFSAQTGKKRPALARKLRKGEAVALFSDGFEIHKDKIRID